MSGKNHKDVISRMFLSAAVAMIFTQVAGVAAQIIDGIITSRVLGADSYSAVSLLSPMITLVRLVAAFIATGCQIMCSSYVGKGKKAEANAVFSMGVTAAAGASVLFLAACIGIPDFLLRICGVTADKYPALYPGMMDYLRGYMIGIPAMILIQVIGPMIVMDNGKRRFTVSAVILCVTDIIGDLLVAFVFTEKSPLGGTFGMGLATSVSLLVQLLFLVFHFFRKNAYFTFSPGRLRKKDGKRIVQTGFPTLIQRAAITLRELLVNRINLMVALSTAAVAAKGLQSDLNLLLFCIGLGIGKTLVTMTGVYYSANDRKGLKRLFSYAFRVSVMISGITAVIVFVLAPVLAGLYTADAEVLSLGIFSIRCMAVSLVLDVLACFFVDYLQGIQNRRMVNILNVADRLVLPTAAALALGLAFGSRGIMASVAVSKVLLMLLVFGAVCVKNKGIPKKAEDFMLLPARFGGAEGDNLYAEIRSMEDVVTESRNAEAFCLAHGTDKRKAMLVGLFVEELAGNIVQHGNSRKPEDVSVDFRLSVTDGRACLSLRDYQQAFDPMAYYAANDDGNPENMPGIRMVMKMAKEVRYFNAFNSNNMMIYMD